MPPADFPPKASVEASNRFAEEHDTPAIARQGGFLAGCTMPPWLRNSRWRRSRRRPTCKTSRTWWLPDPGEPQHHRRGEPTDDPERVEVHRPRVQSAERRSALARMVAGAGAEETPVRRPGREPAVWRIWWGMEWTRPCSRRRKNRGMRVWCRRSPPEGVGGQRPCGPWFAHPRHGACHRAWTRSSGRPSTCRTEGLERERIAGHLRGEYEFKDLFLHHYVGRDYQWERDATETTASIRRRAVKT